MHQGYHYDGKAVKKLWPILILLAALAGGGFWYFSTSSPSKKNLSSDADDSVTVERRDLSMTVESAGDISPLVQVDVKPEVSARIKSIRVSVGSVVKAGDLLVELDDRDLLTQKAAAETDIEGTEVALDKAKRGYDRAKRLFERKLVSQEFFENAKTDQDAAENEAKKAQSKLRQVLDQLSKTKILAPMPGTVLSVPVVEGQVVVGAASVNSGTTLMTLADLSSMVISTHINQVDIAKLQLHQAAEFHVDSIPDHKMTGKICLISPIATVKNNIKGFSVQVLIDSLDARIRPGMTADLTFPIKKVSKALSVPLSAVFTEEDDKRVVYIPGSTPEAKPQKRPVEVGVVNLDYAEIVSGLKEGDRVLLSKPQNAG